MKVKLVAHRGESIIAPENTLEAFALAWARGARAIEGDFHLSKDGHIICMHDSNTRRTTGVDAGVTDLTLAEIKRFDAGLWKGEAWRYTRVPTLDEVLAGMPEDGEIYIELKSVGPIVDALKGVFAKAGKRAAQLSFITFNEESISAVKKLFPAHQAYWLTMMSDARAFTPAELARKLLELGVDGVDINFSDFVTAEHVDAVHAAGKSFHVWTVDDGWQARRAVEIGVDSITTNRAAAIKEEIR